MCGIYFTNSALSKQSLSYRLEKSKFRGRDNSGVLITDGYSFGHNRLAIVDLDSRSNQPFIYGGVVIVFNGEVYNFIELRDSLQSLGYVFETESDTEVICASYLEWGIDCLARFVGMFSFVLYDTAKDEIFCARDRLGVKPLYYTINDSCLEIASQVGMIENKGALDPVSVELYKKYGYVPTPKSIYCNILKLEAGSYFILKRGQSEVKVKSYWNIKSNKRKTETSMSSEIVWKSLIEDAVKVRLVSDLKIGAFLSSGVDSTVVTKLSKLYGDLGGSFTVGFGEKEFDESSLARVISERIGIKNSAVKFDANELLGELDSFFKAFDEPFSDVAALPSLAISKMYKKHFTVAMSGDGGDELFLGYRNYRLLRHVNKLLKVPFVLRIFMSLILKGILIIIPAKRLGYLAGILSHRNSNDFAISYFSDFQTLSEAQKFHAKSSGIYDLLGTLPSLIEKVSFLNTHLWLESNNNVKVDRSSMYYGIEVRSPFMDHRLFEYWRKNDLQSLYDQGRKSLLRSILQYYDLEELVSKKKKGFSVPISEWIRGEILLSYFSKVIHDRKYFKALKLNYFHFHYILFLHRFGLVDNGQWIWRVLVLLKWYDEK